MEERIVGGVTSVVVGRSNVRDVLDGLAGPIAVLTQPSVRSVAQEVVAAARESGVAVAERTMPDGDAAKTLPVVAETIEWLAGEGIRRDGALIGIGGGALTDVAGLIAATFMRGIEARFVPTTLLGAIDASIGGKTAVNVGGKNLMGTFTHPERVVIDLDILDAIDDDLRRQGMAEAIKAGLIGDPLLFGAIERDGLGTPLDVVVSRAIEVKAIVIDADFRESGVRAHLNFGHTIGHAVEMASGWSHGDAVSVGMVAAAEVSRRLEGFQEADRVGAVIELCGLPMRGGGSSHEEVRRLVGLDKKGDAEGMRMVLLKEIGRPTVRRVDSATLDLALSSIGFGAS